MLGKLIKHEFVATWKYFLLIDAITIVVGLFAGIIGYSVAGRMNDLPETVIILLVLCLTGYIFAMISVTILTTVYNVVHYYKSLYTSQGYLTFTLPTTTTKILSAKMLVAFIWQIVCCLCVTISVSFLVGSFVIWGLQNGEIEIWEAFTEAYNEFMNLFGLSGVFLASRYIFSLLMQIIMNLMMFFFAITIGQLWQKHKILASVVAYFVIRFVFGIVSFIVNLFSGSLSILLVNDTDPGRYFSHTTLVSLILSIVVTVGMYIASIMITDKKLNLD